MPRRRGEGLRFETLSAQTVPWARVATVDKPVIHRECNLQGLTDWMQMMENGLRGFRRFGRNGFKVKEGHVFLETLILRPILAI